MKRSIATLICLLQYVSAFPQIFSSSAGQTVLDLAYWNTSENNILQLNGEWEFYRNKLLSPADFKTNPPAPDAFVKPIAWNDLKLNGAKQTGKGFATYRLLLKNVPTADLSLCVYSVQTSCRIFVNDSMMLEVGKPGASKETTVPMNRDALLHLPANTKDIRLIVQIANFHHRKGGFVQPFEIGLSPAVADHHMMYYLLDVIESSALSIIGMFLFALYIFRRKDLSILYFSLFCLTLSLRPVIAVNYFLASIFPSINWSVLLKLEYCGVLFPCLFMVFFIKKLFPEQLPNFLVKFFLGSLGMMILITLLFPPSVFSWLIPPLLFIIPFGVLVFAVTIIKAVRAKAEGANYAGIGLIVLLTSLILKVMVYASVISLIHVLITGLDIAFIFMMSLIFGARFSLQFAKVERLQHTTEIQRREIEIKKNAIEEQNKNITDSINYAKRIQMSLLPTEKYIGRALAKLRRKDGG
jgi:hypothetical protein